MKKLILLVALLVNSLFSNELNIKFATNSHMIDKKQIEELDRYVDYLFTYPELSVVFEAHTDSIGSKEDNLALSAKRAEMIRNYMISQGIVKDRVQVLACGETMPKVKNDTEENRQINRRVEAKTFVTFE